MLTVLPMPSYDSYLQFRKVISELSRSAGAQLQSVSHTAGTLKKGQASTSYQERVVVRGYRGVSGTL